MRIRFYTFQPGHVVSDGEFNALQKGFAKVGMELVRKEDTREADIYMVKGFSHKWDEIPHDKPVVYYNIGTDPTQNDMVRELYYNSNAVVSISKYCEEQAIEEFGERDNLHIIMPAREINLPSTYPVLSQRPLKLATTCIPRPVKRVEDTESLCKRYNIELITAYGNTSDFSYYHDCDGYIHLSRKEGMPNTVLEALAYGLPCIVTNHGGAKEAVGEAGVIIKNDPDFPKWLAPEIEPVDEMLFEEAIRKFVNNLAYLRARVRERVLTELNDKITAAKFKKVYENISI